MITNRILILGMIICAFAGCSRGTDDPVQTDEPRPNILIISMDTVRADHCSVYGYPLKTTPVLEKLAETGVLFEYAYAPTGITGPSHATLFTGLHVITHGVVQNGLQLRDGWSTLAEQLSERGYQTAGIISSFPLHSKFGYAQGFHHYDDEFIPGENTISLDTWEGLNVETAFDRHGQFTTQRALNWFDSDRDEQRPFFMFLHYFDAHSPYQVHEGMEQILDGIEELSPLDRIIRLYDQEIAKVDREIGRIVDYMKENDLFDDTVILITSDHGEGLMDHGYMLHAATLFEEEVRIPMLLHYPPKFSRAVIQEPVGLIDIVPTLAPLAGYDGIAATRDQLDDPAQNIEIGRNVFDESSRSPDRPLHLYRRHYEPGFLDPEWDGTLPDGSKPELIRVSGEQYAVLIARKKYLIEPQLGAQGLFDLVADPKEKTNIVGANADQAAAMKQELERWVGVNRLPDAPKFTSESDKEALQSLGYVQ